jgi:hypothetical protein
MPNPFWRFAFVIPTGAGTARRLDIDACVSLKGKRIKA